MERVQFQQEQVRSYNYHRKLLLINLTVGRSADTEAHTGSARYSVGSGSQNGVTCAQHTRDTSEPGDRRRP